MVGARARMKDFPPLFFGVCTSLRKLAERRRPPSDLPDILKFKTIPNALGFGVTCGKILRREKKSQKTVCVCVCESVGKVCLRGVRVRVRVKEKSERRKPE
ncbi:hypothetical protein LX32DRAFT_418157 [Colletotrichum zoysiae]|uniref:Uncharacterized protein n=1 Tax=Colletotrichum zoysiae TaxID=1216348 RepID=A0AAD9HTJ2_9PEZI|nr:hypothetical protein LX32DRAFT_418157 [Colletotrichum zoysiae]